jgi:hypothetical protein
MAHVPERRRTPRVDLLPDETVQVELQHRIQLVDISLTGALVACDVTLPVGTRGQLRAGLSPAPFSAAVTVKRHHTRPAGQQLRTGFGAVFSTMDECSRRTLEKFLARGND